MISFSLTMVQEVIDYIEDHISQDLAPTAIAAHFYISVSAVSSLFKIVCGMTMMEYIRNRRLTLAGEELAASNIRIIDLAYKYGYETPEAFTKAFARFHGFPPSFVRRAFPVTRIFKPLKISVVIQGGWETPVSLTKADCPGQDRQLHLCYDDFTNHKGGKQMENRESRYQIHVSAMQYQKEWRVLHSLAQELLQSSIPFKVDGKTMIFAHGLEFPLDKICLTFQWNDEEEVKRFFRYDMPAKSTEDGFKYFDAMYQDMKIRCMFYGSCPGADSDEFLYRNTDIVQIDALLVPVQSLEFYYENAETDTGYYKMVEEWLKDNKQRE